MAPRIKAISKQEAVALRKHQSNFEHQLFPGAVWKEEDEHPEEEPPQPAQADTGVEEKLLEQQVVQQRKAELEAQVKAFRDQDANQEPAAGESSVDGNSLAEESTEKKKKKAKTTKLPYLFDNKQSHPIMEYKPSREEIDSSSLTPSFVLEVTWPRIIEFYHPSSPHCTSFQSTYVALARGIKRRSSKLPVEFHAVNCARFREVCEYGFSIKTVPSLVGLKSGSITGTPIILPDDMDVDELIPYIADEINVMLDEVGGHAAAYAKSVESDGTDEMLDSASSNTQRDHHEKAKTTTTLRAISFKSTSDQVFHDAMASFVVTLTSSLYSQLPHGSALPPDRSVALREFIDLTRWAFPPETQVHELASHLHDEFFTISTSEAGLLNVIGQHTDIIESITWSPRCSSGANGSQDGYSCGLWALMHILSLGVEERHSAVVGDVERLSASYAGRVIRSFVDRFFIHCENCRKLFTTLYDEACCALHNSDHSIVDTTAQDAISEIQDWRELAFWIWEIHNEISVRTKHSSGKGYYNKFSHKASTSLLWPSPQDCPKCWKTKTSGNGQLTDMNSYDRDAVYKYLKETYWLKGIHNNRHILLDKWSNNKRHLSLQHLRERMDSHRGLTMNAFLLIACLLWLVLARCKHRRHRMRYFLGSNGRSQKIKMEPHHGRDMVSRGHPSAEYSHKSRHQTEEYNDQPRNPTVEYNNNQRGHRSSDIHQRGHRGAEYSQELNRPPPKLSRNYNFGGFRSLEFQQPKRRSNFDDRHVMRHYPI